MSCSFRTPLKRFNLRRNSCHTLHLLRLFLGSFSDRLTPVRAILPGKCRQVAPSGQRALQCTTQMEKGSNFIFVIGFRSRSATQMSRGSLYLQLGFTSRALHVPSRNAFALPGSRDLVLPFGFRVRSTLLGCTATRLLLGLSSEKASRCFFFIPRNVRPRFIFSGAAMTKGCYCAPRTNLGDAFAIGASNKGQFGMAALAHRRTLGTYGVGNGLLVASSVILPRTKEMQLLGVKSPIFHCMRCSSTGNFGRRVGRIPSIRPRCAFHGIKDHQLTIHFSKGRCPRMGSCFLQLSCANSITVTFLGNRLILSRFCCKTP